MTRREPSAPAEKEPRLSLEEVDWFDPEAGYTAASKLVNSGNALAERLEAVVIAGDAVKVGAIREALEGWRAALV